MRVWVYGLWALGFLVCVNGAKLDNTLLTESLQDLGLDIPNDHQDGTEEDEQVIQAAIQEHDMSQRLQDLGLDISNDHQYGTEEGQQAIQPEIKDHDMPQPLQDLVLDTPYDHQYGTEEGQQAIQPEIKDHDMPQLLQDLVLDTPYDHQYGTEEGQQAIQPGIQEHDMSGGQHEKAKPNELPITSAHQENTKPDKLPIPNTQEENTDTDEVTLHTLQGKGALELSPNVQRENTKEVDVNLQPDIQNVITKVDNLRCKLRQTMAWQECDRKVNCNSACKDGFDCTFPYCNSLGLCECVPAFCKTDRMCHFFRIECQGNFVCRNEQCVCG